MILTFLGCVIPTLYTNIFSAGYLLYHELPADLTGIAGLICFIGVILGIPGTFERKVNKINRATCIVCTLFCLAFILHVFSQFGSAREKTKRIACSSDIKQIYLALQQYAADYAGCYPPANGAAGLEMLRKNDYLTDYAVYTCPSTNTVKGKEEQPLTEDTVDYVYIGGLTTKSDTKQPLMYDKANNHGYYGSVLFADGTVQGIYGNPWTQNIRR